MSLIPRPKAANPAAFGRGTGEQETGNGNWQCTPDNGTLTNELRKGHDIAARLEELGVVCVQLKGVAFRNVAQQLGRAGPAAGANYEEARSAESRADFIHKVMLAAKEVREALYWLRVGTRAGAFPVDIGKKAIGEATQLAAILGASARTARRNA